MDDARCADHHTLNSLETKRLCAGVLWKSEGLGSSHAWQSTQVRCGASKVPGKDSAKVASIRTAHASHDGINIKVCKQ